MALTKEEIESKLINNDSLFNSIHVIQQNFDIIHYQVTAMHLLEPARIIDDEGFTGFVRIVKNILSNSDIRKRILRMKNIFKKYENNLCAVILVAKKR